MKIIVCKIPPEGGAKPWSHGLLVHLWKRQCVHLILVFVAVIVGSHLYLTFVVYILAENLKFHLTYI